MPSYITVLARPGLPSSSFSRLHSVPSSSAFSLRSSPRLLSISSINLSRSAPLLPCRDSSRNNIESDKEAEEETGANLDLSAVESAFGKSFGSALWFSVLIGTLAICVGGYVYLLVNFGEFSDIPIFNGPSK